MVACWECLNDIKENEPSTVKGNEAYMSETFKYAITRTPAETFDRGITTASLGKPSYGRVIEQHRAYVAALKSIGLEVMLPGPGIKSAHESLTVSYA